MELEEELEKVDSMADFADLFLATYALAYNSDDSEICVCFHHNLKELIGNAVANSEVEKNPSLVTEEGFFDTDEFMRKLSISKSKKCWASIIEFDLENNCIKTIVKRKIAIEVLNKYENDDRMMVATFVKAYLEFQNRYKSKLPKKTYNL